MVTINSTTARQNTIRYKNGRKCLILLLIIFVTFTIFAIVRTNNNDYDYHESQMMKLSGVIGSNSSITQYDSNNDYDDNTMSYNDNNNMNNGNENRNDLKVASTKTTTTTRTTRTTKNTIGYAVSITGCDGKETNVKDNLFIDGAAVLKHSIHMNSIRGDRGGKYDYQMYAIYHPNAESCSLPLKELGYTLLERNTPVNVSDIQGDFLRARIENNGCCGEKELIKLYAYTILQHPIVVHLDLDVLVLKPLDPLFDVMLLDNDAANSAITQVEKQQARSKLGVMWTNQPLPKKINAFFTRDVNSVYPELEPKPIQGGFLVVRPSMNIFQEFVSILLKGDFRKDSGWGGETGQYWGCMTIQGILPYYYDILHPNNYNHNNNHTASASGAGGVELNRCIYNNMCDNPRTNPTVGNQVSGACRTGEQDTCEDCRERELDEIYSTHFTLCQKPWLCWFIPGTGGLKHGLCKKLHQEWFRIRSELEQSWGRTGRGAGQYYKHYYFGYCHADGQYQRIQKPFYQNTTLRMQ